MGENETGGKGLWVIKREPFGDMEKGMTGLNAGINRV